jgi:hypothetical protein
MLLMPALALAACNAEDGGPTASRADILLVVDNSRGILDKQQILALAVPDLLEALVNPLCVDEDGVAAGGQPDGPDDSCPSGTEREFQPLRDIHFGVISTSLGGHGADACDAQTDPLENDRGHLIDRLPGPPGMPPPGTVPTYDDLGFLAWDPDGNLSPAGENDATVLADSLSQMVLGAGQTGCGYESQLESWYRFLVDPDPYETITVQDVDPDPYIETLEAIPSGTDHVLLEQRKNFLRPDSLLAIILLSDENDCSIRDGGQSFYAAQIYSPGGGAPYHLPRPRAACAVDPNDPCCRSCGESPGPGCDDSADDCSSPLPSEDDQINLRCYDQKRRFGIDFLNPTDRYITGLTSLQVTDRNGELVDNPLFSDLDPDDDIDAIRSPDLVFFTSIVGVPWQDVARLDATSEPDLVSGQDAAGNGVGGFQTGSELDQNDTWELILGDPVHYHTDPDALPNDPLMIESIDPRTGINPLTGDPLAPPDSPSPTANPINGHEYDIPRSNDLQYACIFELPEPKDCQDPNSIGCDCLDPGNHPQCQEATGGYGFTQYRAKAYPSIRLLQVVEGVGDRGAVGSICSAQLDTPSEADFGYRPFIRTLVDSFESRLVR